MFNYTEIGIDLGSKFIKIAMVEKTGKSRSAQGDQTLTQLRNRKSYKVDVALYSPEYFLLLKTAIKDFTKTYGLKRISLNISVPLDNDFSEISFITMPIVNDKLMDDGVAFEVEQDMAIKNIEDSEFNWKVVDENLTAEEYTVLLTYLKKNVMNSLAQFKTIKWRVNRLILQPVTLERIAEENDVVVDFGHKSTRVYLYLNGNLNQVEIVDIGGKELLDDIQSYIDENLIDNYSPEDLLKELAVQNSEVKNLLEMDNLPLENKDDETLFVESNNNDSLFLEDKSNEKEESLFENKLPELENNKEDYESLFIDELPEVHDEEMFENKAEEDNEVLFVEDYLEEEVLEDKSYNDTLEEVVEIDNYNEDELYEEVSEDTEEEVYDKQLINNLSDLIYPKINLIIDEIKRIIRMYELQNGASVDSVYYVGQLSQLKLLKETIESELDVKLKPVSFLDMSDEGDSDVTYNLASLVCMDTKLKDSTDFSSNIRANVDYSSLIIILLMMSLSVGLAFKVMIDKYNEQLSELQTTQSTQIQTISSLESERSMLQQSIRESERFIYRMEDLKAQKKWLSDVLYVIPERTPLTISIYNLSIVNNKVTLQGYSSDYSSIGFFAEKLGDIADVEIDSINDFSESEVSNDTYTVTLENPELISDKYKITKSFTMTLTYEGPLLTH